MDANAIIEELHKTNLVEAYVNKVGFQFCAPYLDDIIAEIWVMICAKGDKLVQLYERGGMTEVRGYAVGIIHRQVCSTNSVIYRKYYRHDHRVVTQGEQIDIDFFPDGSTLIREDITLSDIREKLDPFDAFALNTWLEYPDVETMAKATGYPEQAVKVLLASLLKKIRDVL